MFSCFRSIYRRIIILVWLRLHYFIKYVQSFYERFSNECKPILTNTELLNFNRSPILWQNFVQPIASRCSPKHFKEDFLNIKRGSDVIEKVRNVEAKRPKVLVCHDLAGNYREDRFINGSGKWDDYRFYHWSGIDYFCYFSHSYITIPPLPWINAAHQNGVPILGTFIIESLNLLSELLQSESYMNRIVESMVLVTKCCCFDGWLLNIEYHVNQKKVPLLMKFVEHVTKRIHEEIPNGKVFWYDSVIDTGLLSWQNELNEKNIDFFNNCDGILINYTWNKKNLEKTAKILNESAEAMTKVFIGIDVFGRGQVAKFHTHETLQKIKEFNFSIGIFAPAWTFERIQDIGLNPFEAEGNDMCNQHFIRRNNLFWTLLWKYLYSSGPNSLPFYTSFCLGSGKKKFRDGIQTQNEPWFNLLEQEYQPSVPSVFEYDYENAYRGGSCIKFNGNVNKLRLVVSDFLCDQNIVVSFVYKRTTPDIRVRLILNIVDEENDKHLHVTCGEYNENSVQTNLGHIGEKILTPLRRNDLRHIIIGLSQRQEKVFPSYKPINGWETSYFYIKFQENVKNCHITDVGISINKGNWNTIYDSALLGAVHIHNGISNDERLNIPIDSIITENDFS